jgi:hypothetical protein
MAPPPRKSGAGGCGGPGETRLGVGGRRGGNGRRQNRCGRRGDVSGRWRKIFFRRPAGTKLPPSTESRRLSFSSFQLSGCEFINFKLNNKIFAARAARQTTGVGT